jgi:cyclic beta-1,2-glucan synthetase
MTYQHGQSQYRITVSQGESEYQVTLDGIRLPDDNILLVDDGQNHRVDIIQR